MGAKGKAHIWLARGADRPLICSSRIYAAAVQAIRSHGILGPASLEQLLQQQQLLLLLLEQQGPRIHLHHTGGCQQLSKHIFVCGLEWGATSGQPLCHRCPCRS